MKVIVIAIFTLSTGLLSCAQNQQIKQKVDQQQTKIEAFTSKTGTIVKYIDAGLPALKLSIGGSAEARIRTYKTGNENNFFYQIEKQGEYRSNVASIEQADLLEIIKALTTLRSEFSTDFSNKPDYLENKFVTVDGFQIGYYVSHEKSSWFIRLDRVGTDNLLFVNDVEEIVSAFEQARLRIEELRK